MHHANRGVSPKEMLICVVLAGSDKQHILPFSLKDLLAAQTIHDIKTDATLENRLGISLRTSICLPVSKMSKEDKLWQEKKRGLI